jgi:DNA-binding NarL/FixJ family response regulator
MVPDPVQFMLIADDPETRAELAARLGTRLDCVVAAEAASDGDLAAVAAAADPDVIVWDLGDDPDAAFARLADAQSLGVPIVAIVEDEHDGVRALAAGAVGLLPPEADAERLVLGAQAVIGGLLALDPALAGIGVAPSDPGDDPPVEALTRRELEVLRLVAEGLGNRSIAERLGITEHTAKFHVHTILGKLGTQSRTEAVVRAARLGLIAI